MLPCASNWPCSNLLRAAQASCMLQVAQILTEGEGKARHAVGVRLADGRTFRARTVVSNATHWDTFDRLLTR